MQWQQGRWRRCPAWWRCSTSGSLENGKCAGLDRAERTVGEYALQRGEATADVRQVFSVVDVALRICPDQVSMAHQYRPPFLIVFARQDRRHHVEHTDQQSRAT